MSTMDVRVRMGDTIDPFQLANGFEAVIGYECQERSNHPSLTPTMHIIHARCYKASEWVGGEFTVQARYLGDLVDVVCGCLCCDLVTCMSL